MAEYIKLNPEGQEELRTMNPRLISYNVEMTEVTGGTFWKAYTDSQIDGTGMPEGYNNHLRKEQWVNLCNFVKAVGGKLKVSVANCDGLHAHDEPWNPSQAKLR